MKKIIFPFYKKERHGFLNKKWWFRTIIVIYTIALVITPFAIWLWYIDYSSGWCYDSIALSTSFGNHVSDYKILECSQIAREAWTDGIPIAIFGWLLLHYLIQVIFFKIIINYIVLGGKNNKNIKYYG